MERSVMPPLAPTHPAPPPWIGPSLTNIDLGAAETHGEPGLFTTTVPPMGGPPPHVHAHESETFYVLDGTFEFFLDGEFVLRRTGGTAYVPAGTVHTFRNVGKVPGRLLTVVTPGGLVEEPPAPLPACSLALAS